jgi:hypothetical protein
MNDDRKKQSDGFHGILMELCERFRDVPRAIRMQALVIAALAMVDASSIEERKGAMVTEEEFVILCRRFFRKVRS